ncbi:hypothetical protein GCM10027341_24630 [Spirosoma knui]
MDDLINQVPCGIFSFSDQGILVTINTTASQHVGYPADALIGQPLNRILTLASRLFYQTHLAPMINLHGRVDEISLMLLTADGTSMPVLLNAVRLENEGEWVTNCAYLPVRQRHEYESELIKARKATQESEARFRNMIAQAPVAIGVLEGEELVVESANEQLLRLWGKSITVLGLPLLEALPEVKDQGFVDLLLGVYRTGGSYYGFEELARLHRNGQLEDAYFNFVYAPVRNDDLTIRGVMVVATEVTAQVKAKKELKVSEKRFRNLIDEAPMATALYVGRDLVIELANAPMITMWGKDTSVIGRTLPQALPELEGQPFLHLLDEVYTTGIAYQTDEQKMDLVVDGRLQSFYVNFMYKPLLNAQGQVYAILNMAVDISNMVLARQKLKEAEQNLWQAVDLAELGTFVIDPAANRIEMSPRFRTWLGYKPQDEPSLTEALRTIIDQGPVEAAIQEAFRRGINATIDIEHRLKNPQTNRVGVYHTQARVITDTDEKRPVMIGTSQDITVRKQVEQELERQVAERTQLLQEANRDLKRSNDNLQQFAYVASHDLQEPLRKIQSFGDLLMANYSDQLGSGTDYLQRMQTAARRMSGLIKDLLAFSRITTQQETTEPVSLAETVARVEEDLDMAIRESNARIDTAELPTIRGDESQLRQLFQNLLSNAIKFRSTDTSGNPVHPIIRIDYHRKAATDLPVSVKPARQAQFYHSISVADNGIGFDDKYVDRIFQVFQRLHGRSEYTGTGIGLAICQKVVANHGGAITATSQPGKGTTFYVYLPIEE